MKNQRLLASGLVGLIVCLLLGQVTVTSMAGTGPELALPPDGEWHELDGGGECWYDLQYAGDGSQIEIHLQVESHQGFDFEVWTPAGIERRGLGLESDPVAWIQPGRPLAPAQPGSHSSTGGNRAVYGLWM
jgi:hypothetical protein